VTDDEKLLVALLKNLRATPNQLAVLLQSFIADRGSMSEEAGAQVREILKSRQTETENDPDQNP
jgi:hypothetical protein